MSSNQELDVYSGWEDHYQQSVHQASWKDEPSELVNKFMQHVAVSDASGVHFADFGSGDGRNLWPWLASGANIAAVDIAPTALKKIASICIQQQLRCPTLIRANLEELPLADDQFDYAQCIDALPQVNGIKEALAEITRTLRPNGFFLFNTFTPADCAFGEGEQVEPKAFRFKNTLFRFLDHDDLLALIPSSLEIVESIHERWEDPPHMPFRPYAHIHDGYYYICRKQG